MKIKAKEIKFKNKYGEIQFEYIEIELTSKEFRELNMWDEIDSFKPFKPLVKEPNILCYNDKSHRVVKLFHYVEILPSEECVTNTDQIIYNEKLSGKKGVVLDINSVNKTVKVSLDETILTFVLPVTWVKFLDVSKPKNK